MALVNSETAKTSTGEDRYVEERDGDRTFIRDTETGEVVELKGYGALKGMLELDPDIDLTKPIWEQVQRKRAAEKRKSKRSNESAA